MSQYSTLKIRQSLKSIGFSDNEIKVLLFLFRQKKATTRSISQNILLGFTSTQYALSSLIGRGLVVVIPQEEEHYQAISSQHFQKWLLEMKKEHQQKYEQAKSTLSRFFSSIDQSSWKPDLLYYEGVQGIQDIYEDMLQSQEPIYCWTNLHIVYEVLGVSYMDSFHKRRIDQGIDLYTINAHNEDEKSNISTQQSIQANNKLDIQGEICMYGNKVALIQLGSNPPIGFVFEGDWMCELFHAVFRSFWH